MKRFYFFCFLFCGLVLCGNVYAQDSSQEFKKLDQQIQDAYAQLSTSPEQAKKNLAVLYYNKAVLFYKSKNDAAQAKIYINKAIQMDPKQPAFYETLGDLQYLGQDMSNARASYQRAYSLDRNSRLKEKMAKVGSEMTLEKDLKPYRSSHFIIRYANDNREYQGYQLLQILDEAYNSVGRDFKYYPRGQVTVLLYGKADYYKVDHGMQWSAAVYDGKMRVSAESTQDTASLKTLIFHEYTHALITELTMNNCPAWLHEGLAQYEESKIRSVPTSLIKSALSQNKYITFDILFRLPPAALGQNVAIQLYYEEAYSVTVFFLKRYGWAPMRKILAFMRQGSDFESALKKVLNIPVKAFETNWKSSPV